MSSPVDDASDEVKVFRSSSDVDEVSDNAQSSQQLSEDKKDVAYEAELDAPSNTASAPNFFLSSNMLNPSVFNNLSANLYPVFLQNALSPHYATNRLIGSPSFMLSPNLAALSMCSPQYAMRPTIPPAAMTAAFMNPQASLFTPNFSNTMTAQNLQRYFVQQQMQNNLKNAENVNPNLPTPKRERMPREKKDKNHIKKPCNAFMLFMRENRNKFSKGSAVKQSSELNKEMGKAWHSLAKEEQEKYFEMAKEAREEHSKQYPNWSARDNYAINKKKRKKRERSLDPNSENNDQKKCRARFGIEQQQYWCKHCKRKKRCLNVRSSASPVVVSSTTNPTTPTHPFASPSSAMSTASLLSPAPAYLGL